MKLKKNKFIIGLSTTVLGSALAAGSQVAYADEPVDISSSQTTGANEISEPSEVNFAEVRDGSDLGGDEKSVETPSENDPQAESVDEANSNTSAEDIQSSTEDKEQTSSDANDAVTANKPEEDSKSDTEEHPSVNVEAGAESSSDSESTSEEAVLTEPETNDKESGEAEPVEETEVQAEETKTEEDAEKDTKEPVAETVAEEDKTLGTEAPATETDKNSDTEVDAGAVVGDGAPTDGVSPTAAAGPTPYAAATGEATQASEPNYKSDAESLIPKNPDGSLPRNPDGSVDDSMFFDEVDKDHNTASLNELMLKLQNEDAAYNQDAANESKYLEGVKIEVLDPASKNPGTTYELAIITNTNESGRAISYMVVYDDFTNTIKVPRGGFNIMPIKEGDETAFGKIVTDEPDGPITIKKYVPRDDNGKRKIFYEFSDEIIKAINEEDTVVFGFRGEYPQPVADDVIAEHIFTSENFRVNYALVPFPNENRRGELITLNTSNFENKINPVKDQIIDTKITVNNLLDHGSYNDVSRLVGQAYDKDGNQLDDVEVYYEGDQVKVKLPEGALQSDGSIFNPIDGKVNNYKDLRIELFMRPRNEDELKTEVYGFDSSFINLNQDKFARYNHYNKVGQFDLKLDDESNYDIITKDLTTGKIVTDKMLRLKAGVDKEIEQVDKPNSDAANEYITAKSNDEAVAYLEEEYKDFLIPVEGEENKYRTKDNWLVEVDPENPEKMKVSTPIGAKRGENLTLPVTYLFTNGSEKNFLMSYVVNEESIEKPDYEIAETEAGQAVTSTPTNEYTDVKPKPVKYELESTSIVDNKGKTWTLSIDENTGVITATAPGEVDKSSTINVPVIATYVDQKLKDIDGNDLVYTERSSATFTARAPQDGTVTFIQEETIPFETVVRYNPDKDPSETGIVQIGKNGKVSAQYSVTYKDGEIIEGPNKLNELDGTKVEAQAQIIEIGTKKPAYEDQNIPFKTTTRETDDLLEGEEEILQEGVVGIKRVYEDETEEIIKAPVNEIKLVGTRKEQAWTPIEDIAKPTYKDQEIEFKTITQETKDLKEGEEKVLQKGVVGIKRVYEDNTEEIIKAPVNEIKLVGTRKEQAWTPIEDIAKPTYEDQEIEFKTTTRETDDLPEGEEEILQEGAVGIKRVYKDGTVEVIKEPINEIKLVGIKSIHTDPNANIEEVELDTIYEVDYNLDADEEVVIDEGIPAIYLIDEDGNRIETLNPGRPRRVKVGIDNLGPEKLEIPELKFVEEDLKVIRTADDSLAEGEEVIDDEGQTAVYALDENGEKILPALREGTPRKVRYGTKKSNSPANGTFTRIEKIPFGRQIIEDASLAAGTYKIVQEGKVGSKEITYTLEDGKVISEKLVSEVPAQDLIIHIGTKKTSSTDKPTVPSKPAEPTIKKIVSEIPYDTVFIYDNTIEAGKKVVTSPGQKGEKIVTITSKLVDGKIVTQTTEEIIKQPKTEFVRVGTRAPQYNGEDVVTNESKVLIPFETEIIYDDTLPLGQTEVVSEGRDGIQVVTITTRYQNGLVVDTTTDGYVEREAINKVVRVGTKTDGQAPTIDENTGIIDIPTTTEDNDHIIVIPEGAIDDENHVVVIPEEAENDEDDANKKNRPVNDNQVVKGTKNIKVSEDDANAVNIKRSAVSSTNPKTGITGTAGIISTLAISLAGITASRKKKENDEE